MSLVNGKDVRNFLCLAIIFLIGFQQFPVIRIGGSFKLYELISIVLFFASLATGEMNRQKELFSFLFFIVSPFVSYVFFLVGWQNDIHGYYERFGNWDEFRYNYYVATFVSFFYFFLCWVAFSEISKNHWLYLNRRRVIRGIVLSAHVIGWYAILSSISNGVFNIPTPIQLLPDWLQNIGDVSYGIRASGFSQEPSFYVFFQGWVVIFTYYYRHYFSKVSGVYFFVFSSICLFLTLSSALVGFVFACFLSSLFNSTLMRKIKAGVAVLLFSLILIMISVYYGFGDLIYYAFFEKLQNFFSEPETTIGSGQFRAYTASLGFHIFRDYPFFGVGPGASIFFMHAYEGQIPIKIYGETLNAGSFPQNTYVSILSDLGVLGFLSLSFFLLYVYRVIRNARRISEDMAPFHVGVIFTLAALLSIAPAYSMFIWVFLALGVCFSRGIIKDHANK
ncbi:O-antigen ligase family protein [Pectobacterium brasiliense]|uniref:O-antigen ligase family protein n=1 Tax=Pectobacterium brasiliense TaxID=180957 RepID=UPI001968E298|nr:O-antigen ligase family protein [Pectobacterium brasiliense]MBN3229622.1 O-antigen ligase family protein [Pectobacterium brasiliense]